MKRIAKRIYTQLLVLIMIASVLPVEALASSAETAGEWLPATEEYASQMYRRAQGQVEDVVETNVDAKDADVEAAYKKYMEMADAGKDSQGPVNKPAKQLSNTAFAWLVAYVKNHGELGDARYHYRFRSERMDDWDNYYYVSYDINYQEIEFIFFSVYRYNTDISILYVVDIDSSYSTPYEGGVVADDGSRVSVGSTRVYPAYFTGNSTISFYAYSGNTNLKSSLQKAYPSAIALVLSYANTIVMSKGNYTVGDLGFTSIAAASAIDPTSISINTKQATIYQGNTLSLSATVYPRNATFDVRWKTSDSSVATVSSSGTVTAVGPGTCTITASCGLLSDTCTVTVRSNQAPKSVSVGNNLTTGRIKLSWSSVDGASGYNIYRAASANGSYTKLNDSVVVSTTYTDGRSGNAGTVYYYKITPVIDGIECGMSSAVSGRSKCQRPTGLTGKYNADGTVTLSWDKAAVAGSVSYYRIYQWKNGSFQWIGGSLKTSGTTITIPQEYVNDSGSVQYSVRGYNSKNILETMSIYAVPATVKINMVKPVVYSNYSLVSGKPSPRWDPVADAVGYEIWRAAAQNGTYTKIGTAGASETFYTNVGAVGGNAYWYKVYAKFSDGSRSMASNAVKIVCRDARPSNLQTSGADGGIMICWDPVSGADSYRVYRCDTKDGTYTWLQPTTKDTRFVDETAQPDCVYYYKVRACHGANVVDTLSVYSLPVKGSM